ncbi:MAG: DNA primase [Methylobacterium mesophilicum]|nr:DNA primase [Methylobacterium mesophilicum]
MRFPPSFLDEIRDRVPISSLIGARVSWDKRKTNASRGDYWACCPFHGEKSPSFHCEDKKGRYHCFGCGVSGDHFRFLTELEGLNFPEAVERVAEMAGVPMPARDPRAEEKEKQRATLHEVMELATKFFEAKLQASEGAKARAYLRERGLTPATQAAFRLGYAPDSRNALKEHLASKNIHKELIEACGLVVFGDDIPLSYDRFRDRIMFPIHDTRERVIAFGGRALSSEVSAKYLNSPDTELFHKGNVLYNLARARKGLPKDGALVAVEGYMDVITLAQAGFDQAVAPLGTALTERQLELLWRVSPEPLLCFDGDGAGLRAAFRAADLALPMVEPGRTVRFALLPEGQDPDDLVKARGRDGFTEVLNDTRSLADLVWMRETGGRLFDTPERRAELDKTLREATGRVKDEGVRFHYAQEMRERVQSFFGTAQPERGRGGKGNRDGRSGRGAGRPGAAAGRLAVSESLQRSALVKRAGGVMPLREAVIVVALGNHPSLIDENFDVIDGLDLSHPDLRQLHAVLIDALAHCEDAEGFDRDCCMAEILKSGVSELWERAEGLVRRTRQWPALSDASIEDAREALGQVLHLHRNARTLHKELRAAEAALASDPSDEHLQQLLAVQAQFHDAQATEALIEGFGVTSGRVDRN